MALDLQKVLVTFKNKSIGEWQQAVHAQQVLSVLSPIEVYISLFVPGAHFDKTNIMNIMKEVTATLVYEKIIPNSQTIREIACEEEKSIKARDLDIPSARVKSKVVGNMFEQLFFRAAIHHKIGIIRMPDGCKTLGKNKIIRVKTACDFVLAQNGRCALIDTKSQGTGLTFPKANINMNQVMQMNYMANHGAIGGYIVWFREIDVVIFYDSETLRTADAALGFGKGLNLGPLDEMELLRIFE